MSDDGSTIAVTDNNSERDMTYDELVRTIADAIWRQWQRELRHEQERTSRS